MTQTKIPIGSRRPCPVCRRELGLTRGNRIPPHVRPAPTGGRCPGSRAFPEDRPT